jgi:Holliday junction resolvase
MPIDGGLRKLFGANLPKHHTQAIETGGTGKGIPDLNGCCEGVEYWVEMKQTQSWKVPNVKPEQVAWTERRERVGGRVLVAVRQTGHGRGGRPRDVLWLLLVPALRLLLMGKRLDELPYELVVLREDGGPKAWPWEKVEEALLRG